MVDAATRKTLQGIPLLRVNAGPRDGDKWQARLKEELLALITVRPSPMSLRVGLGIAGRTDCTECAVALTAPAHSVRLFRVMLCTFSCPCCHHIPSQPSSWPDLMRRNVTRFTSPCALCVAHVYYLLTVCRMGHSAPLPLPTPLRCSPLLHPDIVSCCSLVCDLLVPHSW